MAELIQSKLKRAKKAIIKCKELLDIAEREIDEAKSKESYRLYSMILNKKCEI